MSETSRYWHPMLHPAQTKLRERLRIVRGDGCYVFDDQGRKLIDGIGGLWCVNVGHNRAEVKQAIVSQLDELEFYQTFNGMSHPRAEELSRLLIDLSAREGMSRVVYGSGGSDAVDTAMKLARQYWKLEGHRDRTRFIALKHAYHGTSFGAVSLNGSSAFRRNYDPCVPGCFHVETPFIYRNPFTQDAAELAQVCADLLEREIQFQSPDTVAAFIAEPIQGAGGVIVPPPGYWPLIREICDKYGVLLIADEVVTGFGRTGSMFGSRGWGVKPDIMCFAKGLSSGYIPIGATAINGRIERAFMANSDAEGVLMHGYTYAGHPVACAAAIASLNIVVRDDLPANAAKQGRLLMDLLASFAERYPTVGQVRGKGLMVAIDLVASKSTREQVDPRSGYSNRLAAAARDHGALVRAVSGSSILCISPPLIVDAVQISLIVQAIEAALESTPAPSVAA